MFRTVKCKLFFFLLEYIIVINIFLNYFLNRIKQKSLQHLKIFYVLKIVIVSKKHKL